MNLLERINRVINDPLFEEVLVSRGLTLQDFRVDMRMWDIDPVRITTFENLPEAYRAAIATVEEAHPRVPPEVLPPGYVEMGYGLRFQDPEWKAPVTKDSVLKQPAAEVDMELLDDQQLDGIMNEEVIGLQKFWRSGNKGWHDRFLDQLPYTKDFNLVLPYLEKRGWRGTSNRCGSTSAATIGVISKCEDKEGTTWVEITAQSSDRPNDLARAAVIALIKATRKEKDLHPKE